LRTLLVVVILGLVVPQLFGGDVYSFDLLNTALIYAILTLGFYWCFSLAGQFTFGVFGLYATGAYVSVWAGNHMGGFWAGLILAVVVSGALGLLMWLLFYRCSAIYFAIATMAIGGLLIILFREWTDVTGGYAGLSDIALPSVFGYMLDSGESRYYLIFGVVALFLLATALFLRSPAARDLTLARDNGPVAAVAGLRPRSLQLVAFTVGCAMQGAAGALYAHNVTYISVEAFNIDLSLLVLLMLLLGGMGSMYGALIGAVLLVSLPELLRDAKEYADLIYAIAVLIIVIVFPSGIAGLRTTILRRWKSAHRN
jgi:branched-chain amino acid transport system permease protein